MAQVSTIPGVWDVPQIFRDRLGEKAGRQRAMFADGHLLLVLHRPPKPEDLERKGRFFWRQPDGTWNSNEFGGGPKALNRHLEEYEQLLVALEEEDEKAVSAQDYFDVLYAVSPIQRTARNMHQALQQARELNPDDRDVINFRDRAYQIERTAELLFGDAKNSLDFTIAKQAEDQAASSHQMSVASHRLNVLVAFFFPIATFAAIFGMNLKHGLEKPDDMTGPLPFFIVLAAGLLIGMFLKSFVTRNPSKPDKR